MSVIMDHCLVHGVMHWLQKIILKKNIEFLSSFPVIESKNL